jgi:3-isopropylmalate/(R)-2-methylmalate dehydratase small subunit
MSVQLARQDRLQFIRHSGIAAPFLRDDVEGELIAHLGPELDDLHHLHVDHRAAMIEPHEHDGSWAGQHAFQGFRYRLDGSENPDFVLNQEPYRDASILIAGRNFGRGSLQGFAAIRLRQCGIRAIIAPSFGPVFYDDCFDYALLPVTLSREIVNRMADCVNANPQVQMTVDLEKQTVEHRGFGSVPFQFDARRRLRLLLGRDQTLEERLQYDDRAESMRNRDKKDRPWIYDTGQPTR